jgi:hypothetical protein
MRPRFSLSPFTVLSRSSRFSLSPFTVLLFLASNSSSGKFISISVLGIQYGLVLNDVVVLLLWCCMGVSSFNGQVFVASVWDWQVVFNYALYTRL